MTWLLVGHKANKRRGIVSSMVWEHGDEYIKAEEPMEPSVYICNYCDSTIVIPANQSTSNIRRHFRDKHPRINIAKRRASQLTGIDVDAFDLFDISSPVSGQSTPPSTRYSTPSPLREFKSLYTKCNIDIFRRMLIELVSRT